MTLKPSQFSLEGKTLGKYRIEGLIGRGAMAEVYRGRHVTLNRAVAVKILHPYLLEKEDMLERFLREAQNIAALSHPNIVQVFDFDSSESIHYMVMELIEGETLKTVLGRLQEGGLRLPMREAVRIAKDIGEALAYAHRSGVVHRDIKPANIMADRNGRIVLADFGLARLLAGPQYTSSGTIVGTPAYMSPEQGQGKPGDERSDLYALGILLYEMLTGRPPFIGDTPVAVIYQHIKAQVPSLREQDPAIPLGLEQIIYRTLEKDPENRYPDAGDLLEDLEIILSTETQFRTAAGPERPRPASPATGSRIQPPTELELTVLETGMVVRLTGKDRYMIGRLDGAFEPDLDLGVLGGGDTGVSRLHAEIEVDPTGAVMLSDMDSTNGTWVNGLQVSGSEAVAVHEGDVIAIGRCRLQIRILR